MIIFLTLLVILGIVFACLTGLFALLLDPIIAVCIIYGVYKLIKLCFKKKK